MCYKSSKSEAYQRNTKNRVRVPNLFLNSSSNLAPLTQPHPTLPHLTPPYHIRSHRFSPRPAPRHRTHPTTPRTTPPAEMRNRTLRNRSLAARVSDSTTTKMLRFVNPISYSMQFLSITFTLSSFCFPFVGACRGQAAQCCLPKSMRRLSTQRCM